MTLTRPTFRGALIEEVSRDVKAAGVEKVIIPPLFVGAAVILGVASPIVLFSVALFGGIFLGYLAATVEVAYRRSGGIR